MKLCFSLCIVILSSALQAQDQIVDTSLSKWFSLPIDNVSNKVVDDVITDAAASLKTHGMFHIPDFLSAEGLSILQEKIQASIDPLRANNHRSSWKTILQNHKDTEHYPDDSFINQLFNYRMDFIAKSELDIAFDLLYNYPPLLTFLRAIVTSPIINIALENNQQDNANKYNSNNTQMYDDLIYNNLYLSNDEIGGVYGYIGYNNSQTPWHYDHHPFSCIISLIGHTTNSDDIDVNNINIIGDSMVQGGDFRYVYLPPIRKDYYKKQSKCKLYDCVDVYDWKKIETIVNNDNDKSITVEHVNQGDLYCFKGNITMHSVTRLIVSPDIDYSDQILRAVVVMTFSDFGGFSHNDLIQNDMSWGLKSCRQTSSCIMDSQPET